MSITKMSLNLDQLHITNNAYQLSQVGTHSFQCLQKEVYDLKALLDVKLACTHQTISETHKSAKALRTKLDTNMHKFAVVMNLIGELTQKVDSVNERIDMLMLSRSNVFVTTKDVNVKDVEVDVDTTQKIGVVINVGDVDVDETKKVEVDVDLDMTKNIDVDVDATKKVNVDVNVDMIKNIDVDVDVDVTKNVDVDVDVDMTKNIDVD